MESGGSLVHAYSYDSYGNVATRDDQTLTYDIWGRLASIDDSHQLVSFQYDTKGRRISKVVENGQGTTTTRYIWDQYDRMIQEQDVDGNPLVEYIYLNQTPIGMLVYEAIPASDDDDDCGNSGCDKGADPKSIEHLIKKISVARFNIFLCFAPIILGIFFLKRKSKQSGYATIGLVGSFLAMGILLSHPLLTVNWASKASGFAGMKSTTFEVTPYVLHTDHIGAVIAVTDISGNLAWSAKYKPFGEIYDEDRDVDGDGIDLLMNLRRPGQYHDRETGLYYNQQRYYDPEIGRYTSPEPVLNLQNPGNPYNYALNNPVMAFDPDGRMPAILAAALVGGIVSGVVSASINTYISVAMGKSFSETVIAGISGFSGGFVTGAMFAVAPIEGLVLSFEALVLAGTAGAVSGAAGGFVGGLVSESLEWASLGKCFSFSDVGQSTGAGFLTGIIGGIGGGFAHGSGRSLLDLGIGTAVLGEWGSIGLGWAGSLDH